MANRVDLARGWIELQKTQRHSDARQRLFWAYEQMTYLLHYDPNEGWLTILEILNQDKSDWIIENLGAGPLEDLLVYYGEEFISRIEAIADEPAVRLLAQMVWKNEIPDDVWCRLQVVAGRQIQQ
jgi:uncharacterized protein DUF6869